MKNKAKGVATLQIRPCLDIDKILYKQAESMCAVLFHHVILQVVQGNYVVRNRQSQVNNCKKKHFNFSFLKNMFGAYCEASLVLHCAQLEHI